MSKTVLTNYERTDGQLSVKLYSNGLAKDGSRFGRVSRDTVTLENIIASIIDENHGMDPYQFQMAISLFQQQIIKMIKLGKCVNLLDLGFLFITVKGSVKGENPNTMELPDLGIHFTPSSLLNDAVSSLQVENIIFTDSNPVIDSVINTWDNQNDIVYPGRICRISGNRLKLGGDSYSIKFIPLDSDGSESDTLSPVEVEADKICKNTGSTLEFYVPDSIDASVQYLIRITTSYLNNKQSRKNSLTGDSKVITVQA